MIRRLAAVLVMQTVLALALPQALTQSDTTLERVQKLGIESLPDPVPTYYSPDARARAEALQRRARDMVSFFERRYRIPPSFSLAVLNESHWAVLGRGPYGGMFSSAPPRVVGVPAFPAKGLMVPFFRAAHTAASSTAAGQAWARLGVPYDTAVDRALDAMVFHEVGHALVNGALGFSWTQHWFNEFMATYMAQMFLRSQEPTTIGMWTAVSLDIVQGTKPSIPRTLDDFNLLYGKKMGPENYGWFYSQITLGVTAVLDQKQAADWFGELRAAGLDKDPSLATSQLLDRLEPMTPGLKQWAEKLQVP